MESGSHCASSELHTVDDGQPGERLSRIAFRHSEHRPVNPCWLHAYSGCAVVAFDNLSWSHDLCWAEDGV